MAIAEALHTLARDLESIFNQRLEALVSYGPPDRTPAATLALVHDLSAEDLAACGAKVQRWHRQQLATPLFLHTGEFGRALDAFPFEFGAIIEQHSVIVGRDPFAGLHVDPADLRRACEIQARSHLLHLREAFVETGNHAASVVALIERSAAPLAALLTNLARLDAQSAPDSTLSEVARLTPKSLSAQDAQRLLPLYVRAMEQLTRTIDRWGTS